MSGFLGSGSSGHTEQRASAGGNPPTTSGDAGFDSATGSDFSVVVEMAPTATSRLAIRTIRTIMGSPR